MRKFYNMSNAVNQDLKASQLTQMVHSFQVDFQTSDICLSSDNKLNFFSFHILVPPLVKYCFMFVGLQTPVIALVGNDACWSQIAREQVPMFGSSIGCDLEVRNSWVCSTKQQQIKEAYVDLMCGYYIGTLLNDNINNNCVITPTTLLIIRPV